jgi:transcriptional regulator with XRE-family HTH domain
MNKFGSTILRLRNERNLTTNDVARAVAIPQSRYSELEKGIRVPTDGQIKRLEKFFNLTDGELAVQRKAE